MSTLVQHPPKHLVNARVHRLGQPTQNHVLKCCLDFEQLVHLGAGASTHLNPVRKAFRGKAFRHHLKVLAG